MLALTTPLKTRLQALPQLTGWAVRTGTEHADRRVVPAADVRVVGAGASPRSAGVMLEPQWSITLMVRRGDTAAAELDAALDAVVCTLHGWQPGSHGGRGWEPLKLQRITEPVFEDVGLVGYELVFSTAGLYQGQQ